MRSRAAVIVALSAAWLLSAGCTTADSQTQTKRETPSQAGPQPASSPDEFVVRDEKSRQRDQRGNTPPGMDRSGSGPTSGAIVDPAGAVTRNPVPQER